MAAVKRKAATDDRPSKKPKEAPKDTKAASKENKQGRPRDGDTRESKILTSILQQGEQSFPRGGGSVLTPLEHKQIRLQAEQDALLEEQGSDERQVDGGELFGDDAAPVPAASKKRGKPKLGKTSIDKKDFHTASGARIQGLTYKHLNVGSTVLGRVTAITGKDVALALPNNLTGYVPITSVSQRLNARIEEVLEDNVDAESDDDIDLKQIFHLGQWLRASVIAMGTDSSEAGGISKRRIELSLDPASTNGSLTGESFTLNSTVQASIRSIEDHGLIMDLGLADEGIKGFVSKKELGSTYSLDQMQEGQVMLCLVTGKGSNGKVLKLSSDPNKFSIEFQGNKPPTVGEMPTVDAFLPGTGVDVLVTDLQRGLVGTIMGMLGVTADIVHSGAFDKENMSKELKVGSKIKARIIYALAQDDGSRRLGVSLLPHALALVPPPSRLPANATSKTKTVAATLDQELALSTTIETAKITYAIADRGVFLELPVSTGKANRTFMAFAHISQLSDSRVDSISSTSGAYTPGSIHKARIVSYNPIDDLYYVSLRASILSQRYIRLEDLAVGELVTGTVEKIILGGPKGLTGVLVKLSESITALAPEMHLSETQLAHPERKYREGLPVKARVLSVDTEKRHVRLTFKRSLVDEMDTHIWKDYLNLASGMESRGTIISLQANGAVVQFYGPVRAWLPVAEMSETFVANAESHFHLGQTVKVRIISVDAEAREMKVSCKDAGLLDQDQRNSWDKIAVGELVDGIICEKSDDSVKVETENGLQGLIRLGHLRDGSYSKTQKELKHLRVGQKLANLLVLNKLDRSQTLLLSNKSSLIEAAGTGVLITSFADVEVGKKAHGFIRNITSDGVYVEFANGVVGLMTKNQITPELHSQASFGFYKDQSIGVWIAKVDSPRERFLLSVRENFGAVETSKNNGSVANPIIDPVDPTISSISDLQPGKITKARITSVKATQLNLRLADNVQGRVDVSETFDSWEEIMDKASPLQSFSQGDTLEVKILGMHDARSHRFLPISHRQGKVPVFELSAKRSRIESGEQTPLTYDTVQSGLSYTAFVNNHEDNCVWVNLSPNVRGRIALIDLSDDVGHLQNARNRWRVGSALRVKVKQINVAANKLDLTARSTPTNKPLDLRDIAPGMILPARVTKSTERLVHVQMADDIHGAVPLFDISDDYDQASPAKYRKDDIVRVCVLAIDAPNKRTSLSLRPSKVLSSSLPVKDPQITDFSQLTPGDIVRGFIKRVDDKGVFVSLGAGVDALVRIADLSDQYVKEWKSLVEVDKLVRGRVLSVDAKDKRVQIGLKPSQVDENYRQPLTIDDLQAGTIVTGKVRDVKDFGAFVDIDNTLPRLSGLCHRSEVASGRIEDVRKLYSAGDVVKAMVLKVDRGQKKISLGLKASYFKESRDMEDDVDGDDDDVESATGEGGPDSSFASQDESEPEGGVDLTQFQDVESTDADVTANAIEPDDEPMSTSERPGLKTTGFDWRGDIHAIGGVDAGSESEQEINKTKKRKRKPEIKEDLTGDLDKHGPRSVDDFERQLLGQPNNSILWMQYMAFQLQLGEIQKAREVAGRALRTIHIRETEEKANIWIAWLNLEVEYGDDDSVEEVFKEACQVQDPLEIHERLASIYVQSGKNNKANAVYERILEKQTFRAVPEVWINYASFLMDRNKTPEDARRLLPRALQSISTHEHRQLTAKFAALEFRSQHGDAERGRTIFEGLLSEWPKWSSGWDMWVGLEKEKDKTRALYERMAGQKMKKRRAKFVFKQWLEFEEREGNERGAERVKAIATEYAARLKDAAEDADE